MIREEDLLDAIAECQGQRNPNASTCMKLASYYIIQDHIKQEEPMPTYSFAPPPTEATYNSGTDFSERIKDMDINDVLTVIDELMSTLKLVNPRLYDGVMRKL